MDEEMESNIKEHTIHPDSSQLKVQEIATRWMQSRNKITVSFIKRKFWINCPEVSQTDLFLTEKLMLTGQDQGWTKCGHHHREVSISHPGGV